jgi:diadenosine tetraphosphate (Ap4A) HIT family hydrolase
MWIHEDDLVVLGHVAPSPDPPADGYPGHLLLVPRRHVESPADLTNAEAERIGRWLSWGSRLLEASCAAEHVYLLRLGDGWAHLHFHLLPRYPGTPEQYRAMEVRDWPGVPRCDWSATAAVAAQLREAAAKL